VDVRYARNGDVSLAYCVLGDGPVDLVLIPGFISHVELGMEDPLVGHFFRRLMSFSRLITYDKRGTGLSDRGVGTPTLDDYMADVTAVMDAVGCERAVFFGVSEGGPTALTFAATYPERAVALALYGTYARVLEDRDYPIGLPEDRLSRGVEHILDNWGQGVGLRAWAPSVGDDPQQRQSWARFQRMSASPADVRAILGSYHRLDVRQALGAITAPTLVVHREGDLMVPVQLGHYLAEHIANAKWVELDGADHFPWIGNANDILDEVEEFMTGDRHSPDPLRKLATLLFTDVVGSTERAAALGDSAWREVLTRHHSAVRRALDRFGGREVKTMGDGFLALFEGPTAAIRCADAIRTQAPTLGLEVKIGIHTGEVEIIGDDIGGIAVHIAARVAGLAGPSEVWVSAAITGLVVGSGIQFEDRGRHTLKGVPQEWTLFSVAA
jgi:class 3 adenylate cyclase/pimeloyl-ACP methyl ester carboxylesterase